MSPNRAAMLMDEETEEIKNDDKVGSFFIFFEKNKFETMFTQAEE